MAISEGWAELLEPGLRAIFETQREALAAQSKIPMLFNVTGSSKAQEHDLGVGGFGDWEEYDGSLNYDDNEQLWKTTYTHAEFVKSFKVERKLVDDDLYNIINRRPRGLATSEVRTREKKAASVFNNAFDSSYTGGDAVELCGAHPYSPSNASTQSNDGTTALSYAAIDSTKQAMRAYEDDRGELVPIMPDMLLVPPELEKTAVEILGAEAKPGTADNDANYVGGLGLRLVVWDYLTDANNWFLIDSGLAMLYLNWFNRAPVEFAMDPRSDFQLEARFRGYARYSYGWSDFRWVYGHEVA